MCRLATVLCAVLCLVARPTGAQAPQGAPNDSLRTHVVKTRDGSTLIGRVLASGPDSVRFESNGAVFNLARSQIIELREVEPGQVRHGEYWFPDPNRTRLFFAPTARMLGKGEGYFSDTYLLFLNFVGGITPQFTMGGGFSIIPSTNPQNNIFYLTPKVGLIETPNFGLATGALIGFAGFEDIDAADRSFGILYGVGSIGSGDSHLDFGAGWGYAGGRISGDPALMLGGATRVSRRASLLTENYYVPSVSDNVILLYGVRFFGEKLSVDLGFINAVGSHAEPVFPGYPWIGFAVKF